MQNDLNEILRLVPEWTRFLPLETIQEGTTTGAPDLSQDYRGEALFLFFERIGVKAIYGAVLNLGPQADRLLKLVRDHYMLDVAARLLPKNATLRRFFQGRKVDKEWQTAQITSLAADLSFKLDEALRKKMAEGDEAGFKVLLPAYIQASANNAVIDFVKSESHWEKQTLQDMNLDSEQEDPRDRSPDDLKYTPENLVLSKEKVRYLNEFRLALEKLFKQSPQVELSLLTVDCIFGLGLSQYSQSGEEMTMRECCERLSLTGETQARRIARCQVLLDKGLDQVRQVIRDQLPAIAQFRQQEINVNCASRRDLRHQLGLTEGEVERLVANRQYADLFELSQKATLKPERLSELAKKGAVAAKVPVDLNSCTVRDLVDILGLAKPTAQRLFAARPLPNLEAMVQNRLVSQAELDRIMANGAVLRVLAHEKANINTCQLEKLVESGINGEVGKRLLAGRPFHSWQELDEYLCCEESTWEALRKNFSCR
jgi:DNA uptake protein ComE-like DNA-binding protein